VILKSRFEALQEREVVSVWGLRRWLVREKREGSHAVIIPPLDPSKGEKMKEEESFEGRKDLALKKEISWSFVS